LCREVADSITWRRFCRIPIEGRVPHPTTLMKLTTRCGTAAVDGCNEALLAKAAQAKLLRTTRLRADTTVVPADVAYPTDSGLLAKAVRRITGELAGLAERAAADAEQLLLNARRTLRRTRVKGTELAAAGVRDAAAGRRRARLHRAVNHLTDLLDATRRIAAQTRQRLSGTTPEGAARRVSLHDGDARPIAKGRLGRPVEFGYKGQVVDNDDGVVLDHTLERGNPADAPQLAPAIKRVIRRTGRRPRTVTADRGYGEAGVENDLHDLRVRTVVIPRKGRPGKARQAHEHRRAFRRTVKWRTGSEARISTLKRQYGWDRTRLDHLDGARIWTGHGVLAHNLVKIATLAG
jgi:IS5 family transposase